MTGGVSIGGVSIGGGVSIEGSTWSVRIDTDEVAIVPAIPLETAETIVIKEEGS